MPLTKHNLPIILNPEHTFGGVFKVIFLTFEAKQHEKLHLSPDKIFPLLMRVHCCFDRLFVTDFHMARRLAFHASASCIISKARIHVARMIVAC